MFDISAGIMKNTYKCKVDNHIIEIELLNNGDNDFVKIWYSYNNNINTTELYYDFTENNLYGANISERQAKLIVGKIKNALKLHNKCMV
jgi:hypothetical protein